MPDTDPGLLLGPLVGGLTATGARLWGRASGPGRLHAWVGQLPDLSDAGLLGVSLPLSADWGFAGIVPLTGLQPESRYYYSLTLSDTPPTPLPAPYPSFQTSPVSGDPVPFSLVFGSCFLPGDRMGGKIFQVIKDRLELDNLQFLMLLGDQVYAEAADRNGLGKVAVTLDEYRGLYEYNWSRPPLQDLLAHLPAFMIMDDHEVDNDWSWADPEKTQARIPWFDRLFRWLNGQPFEERSLSPERVTAALQAYWEHQAMHAPLPDERLGGLFLRSAPLRLETLPEAGSSSAHETAPEISALPEVEALGSFYYHFAYGAAAFFVFDLRTQRVKGDGTRILLGEEQWAAFEEWLAAVKDAYPIKFLVSSSSIMFDMWIDITRDRWNGFPDERERLFRLLSDQEAEGVYILTGDLHSSHAIRASLKAVSGRPIPFWEFCASPFEQSHSILARFTYHPVHSDLLLEQVLDFRAAEYCFGVVKIEYADGESPRARFRVYGAEGELLAEAG